jgi:uroporphyrinogen-III synthase
MRAVNALGEEAIEQLASGEIDGVILMSPRTAALYATLMRKHGLTAVARRLTHFCLSSQIAQRLKTLGDTPTQVAEVPRLEEVLALIDAAAARSHG